jgi:hypothetical protein
VSVPEPVRAKVRAQAGDRCGYCLSPQRYVLGQLEIEHIVPTAVGGADNEGNLWLSCRMCNLFKGAKTHARDPHTGRRVRLFNPRRQRWSQHFVWGADGTEVRGLTPTGRATVAALQLNNMIALVVRAEWVSAGWHPPSDLT